ncbi:MAG: aminotransferase class IV [Bacteroidota bacterium]|nr:aminotransferase class IV [Bacteroidota bacterium]
MQQCIYCNGEYLPAREARVPAMDAGMLYGAGLFETLLARQGRPRLLGRHLRRLRSSCAALDIPCALSDEETAAIIGELLRQNGLDEMEARVKIVATPGDVAQHWTHRHDTVLIIAEPYLRPPQDIPWKLRAPESMLATPIARHKSTSYLAYRHLLHTARREGYDDTVLLDRHGNVSECSFTSLLLFDGDRLVLPTSPDALPGITAEVMAEICRELGMQVERRPVAPAELTAGPVVCVCNALLGPFPVARIGAAQLPVFPAEGMLPLRQAWLDFS